MRTVRVRLFTQAKIRFGPGLTPRDHETEYSPGRQESPARTIRAMPLTRFTHARISPELEPPICGAASDNTPSTIATGVALMKKPTCPALASLRSSTSRQTVPGVPVSLLHEAIAEPLPFAKGGADTWIRTTPIPFSDA